MNKAKFNMDQNNWQAQHIQFGQKLRLKRAKLGIPNQKLMAEKCKLSQATISRWESGDWLENPKPLTIERIMVGYRLNAEERREMFELVMRPTIGFSLQRGYEKLANAAIESLENHAKMLHQAESHGNLSLVIVQGNLLTKIAREFASRAPPLVQEQMSRILKQLDTQQERLARTEPFLYATLTPEDLLFPMGINLQGCEPEEVKFRLAHMLKTAESPAYIIDPYCDVIFCNDAVLQFLDLPAEVILELAHGRPAGANMLFYVISDLAIKHFQAKMELENWQEWAYRNMMIFKTLISRFKDTEYFNRKYYEALVTDLRQSAPAYFAYFEREVHNKNRLVLTEHLRMKTRWGDVVCSAEVSQVSTSYSKLYFCIYTPSDFLTRDIIPQIVEEAGDEVYEIGAWPEKRIITTSASTE